MGAVTTLGAPTPGKLGYTPGRLESTTPGKLGYTPRDLGAVTTLGTATTLGAVTTLGADGMKAPIVVSEKIPIFAPLPAGYQ